MTAAGSSPGCPSRDLSIGLCPLRVPLGLWVSAPTHPSQADPWPLRQVRKARPTVQLQGSLACSGTELEKRPVVWEKAEVAEKGKGPSRTDVSALLGSTPPEPYRDPVLPLPAALGLYGDTASHCLPLYLPRGPLDQVSWALLS